MALHEENLVPQLCYLGIGSASRQEAARFWSSLGSSLALQCSTVGLLLALPILMPGPITPSMNFNVVPLTSPLTSIELPSYTKPRTWAQPLPERPEVALPATRVIRFAQPKPPLKQRLKEQPPVILPELDRDAANITNGLKIEPKNPRPPVETGVLSATNAAQPSVARPPREVQTGGFGDPNGVPATGEQRRSANIAQRGQFDLPSGPGLGNGTGGANGVQGTIASAGFSNSVAGGSTGKEAGRGSKVRVGQFANNVAGAPVVTERSPIPNPTIQPVDILSKPIPVYTEEGRRLKVEGEVSLMVRFTGTGRIQVLYVIRSLGHGLDEAAVRAAQGIQFKPETHNSQPVDSEGTVHIQFQLAY